VTGRLLALRRFGREAKRANDHALREERLEHIRDAVEQFTFTLGLLISGHDVPEGTSDHDLAARLQHELQPFLAHGDVMRPDFGAFGELRVEGDLLQLIDPVLATLEFDDRCVRQTAAGRLVPARRRRMRLTMRVAVAPPRVIDCLVSQVVARHAS
jgi:hypothetical protein